MTLFSRLVSPDALPVHKSQIILPSPLSGKIHRLDDLPHSAYVQRLFGEGAAIEPSGHQLLAPFDCKVMYLPTLANQVILRSTYGVELRIQLGLDSDKMMAEGFKPRARVNETLQTGQTIVEFDLLKLKRRLSCYLCPVTILNSDKLKGVLLGDRQVMAGKDTLLTMLI